MPRTPSEQASKFLATAMSIFENAQSIADKSDDLHGDLDRILKRLYEAAEYVRSAASEDEDATFEWKGKQLHGRNVSAKILELQGDVETSSGMPEEHIRNGIGAYKKLLRIYPRNVEVINALAKAHLRLEESDEAHEAVGRALVIAPENDRSRQLRNQILNPRVEHENIVTLVDNPAHEQADEQSSEDQSAWGWLALLIVLGMLAAGANLNNNGSPTWTRYWDSNAQHWYWHNNYTGEEQWE